MINFFRYWYTQKKKMYCNVEWYIQGLEICKEVLGVLVSKNTYLLKYIRGINILCKISRLKTKKESYAILVSPCLHILNLKILKLHIRRRIFEHVHIHIHICVHVTVFTLVNELFVYDIDYGVAFFVFCFGLFFSILEKEHIKYGKYLNSFEYSSWL